MKIRFLERLFGYSLFTPQKKDRTRFADLLLGARATATPLSDGAFAVTALHKSRVLAAAEARRISVSVSPLCGFPSFLGRVAKRPGVLMGVLVFFVLLFVGTVLIGVRAFLFLIFALTIVLLVGSILVLHVFCILFVLLLYASG